MIWKVVFTKQAQKDARKLSTSGLKSKAEEIIDILKTNPYQNPPSYEKLVGDLSGAYSRRLNIQHRIVYQISNSKFGIKSFQMIAMVHFFVRCPCRNKADCPSFDIQYLKCW